MTDQTHLQAELFATRQELARRRIETGTGPSNVTERLQYVPERDEEFARLGTLDAEELEAHIDRLKRDIESLQEDRQHRNPAIDQ